MTPEPTRAAKTSEAESAELKQVLDALRLGRLCAEWSGKTAAAIEIAAAFDVARGIAALAAAAPIEQSLTEEEREHIHQAIDKLGDYEYLRPGLRTETSRTRGVLQKLFRFLPGRLAALSSPKEPTAAGWKPIETAPKDGRTLLLGHFNSHNKWRTLRGQWFSAEAIAESWEDTECPEGWYETSVECEEDAGHLTDQGTAMSLRALESAITSEARGFFNNRSLRVKDLQEWSTAPIKEQAGEVTALLPLNRVYVAIKVEHDKRPAAHGVALPDGSQK